MLRDVGFTNVCGVGVGAVERSDVMEAVAWATSDDFEQDYCDVICLCELNLIRFSYPQDEYICM